MRYVGKLYRPPSEADAYILQATIGCSWNHCTYCDMYREKSFSIRDLESTLDEGGQGLWQHVLPTDRMRPEHDRRSEQVQGELGVCVGLFAQQSLELRLLLRVEQPRRWARRPVLGHADGVVRMEPVGGHR